jgi:hypothetical protein
MSRKKKPYHAMMQVYVTAEGLAAEPKVRRTATINLEADTAEEAELKALAKAEKIFGGRALRVTAVHVTPLTARDGVKFMVDVAATGD